MVKKCAALLLCGALLLVPLTGCKDDKNQIKLDPKNPTNITIWHYYNGAQQTAFDELISEFNRTEGKEKGVYVEAHSQGNVSDLESKVLASFRKEVGASEAPDIFSSYADTAYTIEQMGVLVDLEDYMSEEDLATYIDSFVTEGRIGNEGQLRIFPTAKSSEIFMMDKTDFEPFAKDTGVKQEDLLTMEGVTRVAQKYYEWTDNKTPDVLNDGKAFYGRDAMANLFIIGSMQLGVELFKVDNGKVTLQVDKGVMKKIWDNYYVPFVKGYFSAVGRFRSDDVTTGDLIAYTGSTTSANYFPATVESEGDKHDIEYVVLPAPVFEGGQNYMIQQGAGMVVSKTTPEREYASILFLEWFTKSQNNLLFSCTSGYMPVKKDAFSKEAMDTVIEENHLEINPKTYDTMTKCFEVMKDTKMYTNKAFDKGADARKILEYNLSDKAAADRKAVVESLKGGATLEEATAPFVSDESFEKWFSDFKTALEKSVS